MLLAAGTKGKRFLAAEFPHHDPSAERRRSGSSSDISIQAKEILRLKKSLNEIMAFHTGQPVETIDRDMERDNYMSADAAKTYGIVDEVGEIAARCRRHCRRADRT